MGAYERSASDEIAVNELSGNLIKCYSINKNIELHGLTFGEKVEIFSITGNLMFSKKAISSFLSIPSSQGIYLVRVSGNTSKIIIE